MLHITNVRERDHRFGSRKFFEGRFNTYRFLNYTFPFSLITVKDFQEYSFLQTFVWPVYIHHCTCSRHLLKWRVSLKQDHDNCLHDIPATCVSCTAPFSLQFSSLLLQAMIDWGHWSVYWHFSLSVEVGGNKVILVYTHKYACDLISHV